MISFDDFKKLDLRIAKIISAERVENSEKLLKLEVALSPLASSGQGDDPSAGSWQTTRQLIAGIGKHYAPEELISKEIVIVANLEPKTFTLRGASGQVVLESNGMLLAADAKEGPVLLMPEKDVLPGTKIC